MWNGHVDFVGMEGDWGLWGDGDGDGNGRGVLVAGGLVGWGGVWDGLGWDGVKIEL